MNRIKLPALATLTVALIASPATAYADCGDPDQPPCTGPVPTVDQVVAVLAEVTDPDIPAVSIRFSSVRRFSTSEYVRMLMVTE